VNGLGHNIPRLDIRYSWQPDKLRGLAPMLLRPLLLALITLAAATSAHAQIVALGASSTAGYGAAPRLHIRRNWQSNSPRRSAEKTSRPAGGFPRSRIFSRGGCIWNGHASVPAADLPAWGNRVMICAVRTAVHRRRVTATGWAGSNAPGATGSIRSNPTRPGAGFRASCSRRSKPRPVSLPRPCARRCTRRLSRPAAAGDFRLPCRPGIG
jgi:hypothetical protein